MITIICSKSSIEDFLINNHHHREHIHIVVARYLEDISLLEWIIKYPHTVYNRGASLNGSAFTIEWMSENIGRESYIYLNHIIVNYHRLAHINIFIQADASSSPPYINSTALKENIVGLAANTIDFNPFSDGFAYIGFNRNCVGMFMSSWDRTHINKINQRLRISWGWFLLHDNYKNILNTTIENPRFWPGAMFAVTAKAIYEKPVEYYKAILSHLEGSDPPLGHFLERAWPEVFSSNCSQRVNEYFCFLGQPDVSC
eukprot:gene14648-19679_t